jgi:hypothetical protein
MFAPAGNMAMSLRDWAAFCLDQMAGVLTTANAAQDMGGDAEAKAAMIPLLAPLP